MPKKKEFDPEVLDILSEYSVKGISAKAKERLNKANTKQELLDIYNNLIEASDDMNERGELSIQRKDKFENEIWDEYRSILKKKFNVKDKSINYNELVGKIIKIHDTKGILIDFTDSFAFLQTEQGVRKVNFNYKYNISKDIEKGNKL